MDLEEAFAGFVVTVLVGLVVIGTIFIFCVFGTVVGAITGWFVSITPLGPLVEKGFRAFGFETGGLLTHVGAMLGFLGGFLRGIVTIQKEKKQ